MIPKSFNDWWEWWYAENFPGPKTKREMAEIAWHAGQSAVGELDKENRELREELDKYKFQRCPVDGVSCEYARVLVECVVTDIDCPHKKDGNS